MYLEPLTSTPILELAPMPAKKDRGMEMTRAQGQEATRNTRERPTYMESSPMPSSGGRKASAAAAKMMKGV